MFQVKPAMDEWSGFECWLWLGTNLGKGLYCTIGQKTVTQNIRLRTGSEHFPCLCKFFAVVGLRNRKTWNMCPKDPSCSIGLKMYIIIN